MTSSLSALNPHDIQRIADEFFTEGCALISGALTAAEVRSLRDKTDAYAADPATASPHISHVGPVLVLRRCHEMDDLFNQMVTHDVIRPIVEAVMGRDARFNAMNVIRNAPGQAISNWHVDDTLEFPLPDAIARFDARMRMPVFWMTVQVALSDIDSVENGPTQFVSGSHYSGRYPDSKEAPTFEGRGATSVLCKAGDIYLTNHQCWHRGAPNVSDRTRYVMQIQYAQRWADARFKGLA
jgi:ectoine hydroxylase-related dioxygenase (phytanoyl-CoA dioxygenase family)